jgi:LysM repeat protein
MIEIARFAKNKIKMTLWNLKGSGKDPFLYLGLVSAILFIIMAVLGPSFLKEANSPILAQCSQAAEDNFLTAGTKIKESPDLSLIQKNSLTAISPPIAVTPQVLGALVESADYQWMKKEVSEYVIEPGDNLWSIAQKFNISLNTLLWANDLNQNSYLQIGQKLVILPVSGVIHHVQKGDTLSDIAQTYKVNTDEIITFNDLTEEGDIYIGDILIIPDGVMPPSVQYAPAQVPLAQSYFICPIAPPCRITQGLHWYNAVDFSHGKCGEPIYAAAAGTVLKVKLTNSISKWAFGGAGNHLTILHPNGVVTFYGHIQTSFVNPGDYVSQGQIIALVGGALGMPGSGDSTGCHVHFEVIGAKNPFAS